MNRSSRISVAEFSLQKEISSQNFGDYDFQKSAALRRYCLLSSSIDFAYQRMLLNKIQEEETMF